MSRTRRCQLIRAAYLAVMLVQTMTGLRAQSTPTSPAPILSLSVDGRADAQAYQGSALIVNATLVNPLIFMPVASLSPIIINAQNGSWANTIQVSVIDANGAPQTWPLHLATPASGSLTLDQTTTARLAWVMSPSDASTIAPGTYTVAAILNSTTSAGATGWNGIASSEGIAVQISAAPSAPTVDQQEEQSELLANYDHLLGNDSGALRDLNAFLNQQPNNIGALSLKGNFLEQIGQVTDALAADEAAVEAFFAANPGPLPEAPDALLLPQNRVRAALVSNRAGRGKPQAAIQLLDQGTQSTDVSFFDLEVTNIGADAAENIVISQLSFQTLDGTGQVTFNSLLSPRLPVGTGFLAVNDSATIRFFVTVQGTVNSFSLMENGSAADIFGTPASFTQMQTASLNSSSGSVRLTVTAGNNTQVYGQAIPDLSNVTYTGFVNGDTAASLIGALTCTTTAMQGSPVGTYPITCSGLSSPNYTITFVPGTLTITPAALTVTASDLSRQYGQSNPPFSVSYNGLTNGDSSSSLSGTLACASTAAANSPAGTYPIACSGLSSTNYTISYAQGQLTVAPAALTVTANDSSRVYGQSNPSFSASYSGLVNGDSPSSLSGTLSCTSLATVNSPAGTYLITCSGLTSPNYNTSYASGQLTVTDASLIVTANSASRLYGQSNPQFSASYSGFANGDSPSSLSGTLVCASTATASTSVGSYSISCSGLSSTNYTINYVPGQLTITPMALTITANNASRQFGQPNPVFNASYSGFVNGDTPSALSGALVCTTTAIATSTPGTYPINCSGQTSTNYGITYLAGQLTITPLLCAENISASVAVTRSGFSYSPISKRYAQTLTLTNVSPAAITAPLYVTLDGLSSNAMLVNTAGSTACTTPAGSPYVSVTGTLNPGSSATVVLQFADPSNASINYALRMLAGSGQP